MMNNIRFMYDIHGHEYWYLANAGETATIPVYAITPTDEGDGR
jgi:hypothetical protein